MLYSYIRILLGRRDPVTSRVPGSIWSLTPPAGISTPSSVTPSPAPCSAPEVRPILPGTPVPETLVVPCPSSTPSQGSPWLGSSPGATAVPRPDFPGSTQKWTLKRSYHGSLEQREGTNGASKRDSTKKVYKCKVVRTMYCTFSQGSIIY